MDCLTDIMHLPCTYLVEERWWGGAGECIGGTSSGLWCGTHGITTISPRELLVQQQKIFSQL